MTSAVARFCCFAAFAVLLAGCANTQQASGPPAPAAQAAAPAAAAPAAQAPAPAAQAAAPAEPDEPPLTPAEAKTQATGQCWMKFDRSGGTLEAKAKLVDKCVAEKLNPSAASASPKPSRAKPKS